VNLGVIDHDDLLKEKSLWQIYRASRRIPGRAFNVASGSVVCVIFGAYVWTTPDLDAIHQLLLKLAELGVNASVSILGFLIAGLTIFASLADRDLLLAMIHHKHAPTGLSYLKFNFFSLVRTFLGFLVFCAFQLAVIAFGQAKGAVGTLVVSSPLLQDHLADGTRLMLWLSGGLWCAVFLELKSFVFNVHHFIFTMIKFRAVEHNEQHEAPETGADQCSY
jgi:hypothetical protein